ncbi:CDC42 small effector protein 1 isoform X2 [Vidua chalybeata]|uniref:CDC42 small effector protein 1 isoform X2 n=1 Tax=Vidua chalybeata TaxID=81927 RepID=UPI0023A7AEAA|nr:CDC42 small effector protein 1 isoform X2 [Vidua chalybeata]
MPGCRVIPWGPWGHIVADGAVDGGRAEARLGAPRLGGLPRGPAPPRQEQEVRPDFGPSGVTGAGAEEGTCRVCRSGGVRHPSAVPRLRPAVPLAWGLSRGWYRAELRPRPLVGGLCCPDQVSPWSDPAQGSRQLCQHGGTLAATTASMSDFWHKLGCCVVEKPQPKKRRRRIDRSMIGEPMNFVHLTHIGSGDMAAGEGLPMTGAVQEMRSKGGRERQWSNSHVL